MSPSPVPSSPPALPAPTHDLSPLYPDNLSPDDIACARAHVELAIARGLAPVPRPDEHGEMPRTVDMYWKKLRQSRRKAQATAYIELYNDASEQLRRARLAANHPTDCDGCADCLPDVANEWLKTKPHDPLHPSGKCPDCDLWFDLLTTPR
jgi:hypothetical protein